MNKNTFKTEIQKDTTVTKRTNGKTTERTDERRNNKIEIKTQTNT